MPLPQPFVLIFSTFVLIRGILSIFVSIKVGMSGFKKTLMVALFVLGFICVSYFRPEWLVSIQPLSETSLRVVVVTDREEYNLGETINFTVCIVNDKSYAIGIRPPNRFSLCVRNETGHVETGYDACIDWVARKIVVPPRSEHRFNGLPFKYSFKPASKGTYTIHVELGKGASTTVVVS
jgi:hypothetical protein